MDIRLGLQRQFPEPRQQGLSVREDFLHKHTAHTGNYQRITLAKGQLFQAVAETGLYYILSAMSADMLLCTA